MWDDNFFDVESNPYAACPLCGSTHVNNKECPGLRVNRKRKCAWICDILRRKMGRMMGMF